MVERVAEALGPLRERVVFLGGCATGLLLTDTAAPSIRSTKDVDVIVEVGTRSAYYKIEQELVMRGFQHDTSEGAPLCRWTFEDLLLDVMPTDPELRRYLAKTLTTLLGDPDFVYSLQGHLPPDHGSQGRLPMVLEMIGTLARM